MVKRGSQTTGYIDGKPVFRIVYAGPGMDGQPIVNQGWRLYEMRWHRKRRGVRKVKNRYPREALVDVFDTEEDALDAAEDRYGCGRLHP